MTSRKPNYEIGWGHNWVIDQWSFHIDSMPFTLLPMIFRYNYKSNDVFYSPNSFYKVYLTALKIRNWNGLSREHSVFMYSTAYNWWTFTWFVHFELPFSLKGTEKFIPRDCLNSTLIYILFSLFITQCGKLNINDN